LLNIINDLISISKIESGIIDNRISAFNINNLIEDAYNSYKSEADQKNIKMSFLPGLPDDESIINSDKDKVYAILTNLIKNAIKFTNEGSIEFGYWKNEDDLNFFVRDTGIGVQHDRMEVIFERFRQGSELLIRNYEGAGLGLSISKGYVMMLGGRIWVENNKESSQSSIGHNGSVFYFTLPYVMKIKEAEENNKAEKNSIKDPMRNLKILIVEDDQVSEMLLSIVARKISKHILKVGTGLEAIQACKSYPDIDLILMDIKMPYMDGYEATRQIREFNKDVIIIAQTAFVLSGEIQKAIDAGCNDYLAKPVNPELLNNMVIKYTSQPIIT
jgi:CheY-like chemotaxis protein